MTFHPDIVSREPFTPHTLEYLEQVRAFPEGAMPRLAYDKLVRDYQAATDVTVQRISYLSKNLTITGLLAEPVGECRGVVVYNRGGKGDYGILTVHAVMRQFVPLARAGYLVVGSNYRGNDGGEGHDEFGGGDVNDVAKLHTIARTHPQAAGGDFIIGHSRGGMMGFLMQKLGFKANAMVAIAPVCDVRGWQKMDESMQQDRSAVTWPERFTSPTLFLHGTRDEAIPHRHSEELAAALASHGKVHELVLFEGGNHALTRHWDEVMKQTLQWFEKYA